RMDATLAGHAYAKAALEVGAYDALGQSLGLRVVDLLGGAVSNEVPAYFAISVGAPDDMAREAAERVQEGYQRLQLKVGGRPLEVDIEAAHRVQEAVGPGVRLVLDANRGLTAADTITLSQALRDLPLTLEQPCNTVRELAQVRSGLCHPLYMDESAVDLATIFSAAGQGLVEGFGIKLTRMGGLGPMAAARDICRAGGLRHTCDDSWGGDVVAAACVQVAASVAPEQLDGVWIAQPHIEGHYDPENGIRADAGRIRLPSGPGLGLRIDPAQFGPPVAVYD
ncbi:MAG: enolase C-terminal domain-like protein, partial [Pseudomonadota bacterium]|nr:enolase C-terminal domain-like protein [Pseudomonadota bacterium]